MLKQISKPANGHVADRTTRDVLVNSDSDSDWENDHDSAPVSMSCVNFAKVVNVEAACPEYKRHLQNRLHTPDSENEERLAK